MPKVTTGKGWNTYAVLSLGGSTTLVLGGVLDRDSLLAIDGLARDKVDGSEEILLTTTSDEDALVTVRLDDDLLASSATLGTTATTTATGTIIAKVSSKSLEVISRFGHVKRTRHGHEHHHDHGEHHHGHLLSQCQSVKGCRRSGCCCHRMEGRCDMMFD